MLAVVFVAILGLAYVATKKMAVFKKGSMNSKNMRIIEVLPLGTNQYVYIVQIGTQYHLFATTKDKITYCKQIEEEILTIEEEDIKSFNDHLKTFLENRQGRKNE